MEPLTFSKTSITLADYDSTVGKSEDFIFFAFVLLAFLNFISTFCDFAFAVYLNLSRRNPDHRAEMAHPGDTDYRRPNYPPPPKGTPDCPYGDRCYRRNPAHFQEYSHPPSTDFEKNWKLRQKRLRKQKKEPDFEYYDDDEEESDLDDPFGSDASEDEYIPSDDE